MNEGGPDGRARVRARARARALDSIFPHCGRRGELWSAKVGEDVATCHARVSGAEGVRGLRPAGRAGGRGGVPAARGMDPSRAVK